LEKLPTQCSAFDLLTGGGLPTGTITQVFGAKALGKSILCFQAACATVASGRTALVLDTEQSYMSYLVEYRLPGMSKRFGRDIPVQDVKLEKVPRAAGKKKGISRSELVTLLTSSLDKSGVMYTQSHISSVADILSPEFDVQIDIPDEPTVLIVQMPDIMELLKLHGVDAAPTVSAKSENPRVELRLKSTPVYESALYHIVERTKAKLLVYDSLSAPLKATFPNTQDLPARSSSMAMQLSHAQRLCIQFGLAVLTTSHLSIDPIHAWDTTPYGGIILGHDAKFSFELTKVDAKRGGKDARPTAINPEAKVKDENQGRAIWVQRHPAMADYSRYGYAGLDEEGFH
jgi:RecA/RadA recombinase